LGLKRIRKHEIGTIEGVTWRQFEGESLGDSVCEREREEERREKGRGDKEK